MTEYVCLKCWNTFQGRKTDATGRACSRCNSRYIHEFGELVTMFQVLKDRMQTYGKLAIDNQFIDEYVEKPISGDIFLSMNFAQGHKRLWMFIRMALSWDKDKMSAEDFLILKFRALSKEFIKDKPHLDPKIVEEAPPEKPAVVETPEQAPVEVPRTEPVQIAEVQKPVRPPNRRKPTPKGVPEHAWECPKCGLPNAGKQATCKKCGASWSDKPKKKSKKVKK